MLHESCHRPTTAACGAKTHEWNARRRGWANQFIIGIEQIKVLNEHAVKLILPTALILARLR
jgi:hypothetical protein